MLKYKAILFCSLLFALCLQAQTNLVLNPSFEQYNTCPNGQGTQNEIGCGSYRETPDYYNICADLNSNSNVPYPYYTYGEPIFQYPASGSAYVGVITYFFDIGVDEREVVGCELTTPLQIGTKYHVSFQVNLAAIDSALWYNTATDHLGILFTTHAYSASAPAAINNFAQVYSTTVITDTLSWTRVFGSFIADSAYQYMAFGCFFDTAHTNKIHFFNCSDSSICRYATYYFIDDLCVSTDSIYATNYTWTGIEGYNNSQQQINLYPNPSYNGVFCTNTDFINEQVEVFDVLGKSVKKLSINRNIIDLSNLENGIYIIEFSNKEYQTKQKLIINK